MRDSKREYTEPTRKGCKRCGSKTVAWQQNDAGRWYLTEVFEDAEGRTYTERSLLHSTFCGPNENSKHHKEAVKRIRNEQKENEADLELRTQREERQAAEEADYFLKLHDLCKTQREVALDELAQRERERDGLNTNWTSMDHFVESQRERRRVERLTAEIAFMRAALGMAPVYDDE